MRRLALALSALLVLVRCASEPDDATAVEGAGLPEGGVDATPDPTSLFEAGSSGDAGADARVDAGPPVCLPASGPPSVRVELVAEGLSVPWSMAFLPNGDMLVTEREGRLRIVRGGKTLDPTPVSGLPPLVSGPQGGLHGVVVDPDFGKEPFVYLAYTTVDEAFDPPNRGERVARFRWVNETLTSPEILVPGSFPHSGDDHLGGRLAFGGDGKLYVTLGDRHMFYHPQDLAELNGKTLRVERDGGVPGDNPFVGRPGAIPSVFTYGHRNPQGLAWSPWTGLMFETEHGNSGGDEINILEPGKNYGYPLYEKEAGAPGITTPTVEFTPSIAPSGAMFYTSNTLRGWCGSMFVAGLISRQIVRIPFEGRTPGEPESLFRNEYTRIRDVVQSPEGYIYFSEDEVVGARIWRVVPDAGDGGGPGP